MNSREIIKRTLEFARPERVARSFQPADLVQALPQIANPAGEWRRVSDSRWQRVDEWGNLWARADDSSKGQCVQGALEELGEVDFFSLPDFDDPDCYIVARETFAAHPEQWHIGRIYGLTFSVAREIRRLDQYLIDLLTNRERIRVLHDRVDESIRAQIKGMADVGADSIIFYEDWGSQQDLLISPKLWRDEFKPRFAALCRYAHSLNLTMFMHSCGRIGVIVPDLIEVGIDAFQFNQPRIHGLAALRRWQDRGAVTFWCPVDIQATLPSKNESSIRQEARDLLTELWRGRGGFIAGYYTDNESLGLDAEWQGIACSEFLERGRRELFELHDQVGPASR